MSDLLPCPFCGGEAKYYSRDNNGGGFGQNPTDHWISCEQCYASMGLFDNRKEAIAAWNRRAPAWQPIATAPKDGRSVLLWGKVTWYDESEFDTADCKAVVGYYTDQEWRSETENPYSDIIWPEAWQPMPQPPAPASDESKPSDMRGKG